MDIAGTTALVTGGASGLGLATARRLHAAGASVVLLDLPSSQGDAIAKELGEKVLFSPGDVTDANDVAAALDTASTLGPLRVAVNCAGIGNANRTVGKNGPFPLDAFTRVVTVNLIGTFNVIRLAAERISQAEEVARRTRRDREHRFGRRVRRPDRPGRLLRFQGRHRRPDAAGSPGPGRPQDPGGDDRSRPVQHPAVLDALG